MIIYVLALVLKWFCLGALILGSGLPRSGLSVMQPITEELEFDEAELFADNDQQQEQDAAHSDNEASSTFDIDVEGSTNTRGLQDLSGEAPFLIASRYVCNTCQQLYPFDWCCGLLLRVCKLSKPRALASMLILPLCRS